MAIRKRSNPPRYAQYGAYKPWLRIDFCYACVYCTIHEGEFGGYHSFHVEHFRPTNIFPKLETEYSNLLYACWRCNSYKLDDWPSDDPLHSGKGYLDPCVYDYAEHFQLNSDGSVKGTSKAAEYMVERLNLNCEFLRKLRNERLAYFSVVSSITKSVEEIDKLLKVSDKFTVIQLQDIQQKLREVLQTKEAELNKRFSPPYEYKDLR